MARTKFPWQKGKQNSEYELETTYMENLARGRRPGEKPPTKIQLQRQKYMTPDYLKKGMEATPEQFQMIRPPRLPTGRRGSNKA